MHPDFHDPPRPSDWLPPDGAQHPTGWQGPEGRTSRGFSLASKSWEVIHQDRSLVILPALSLASLLLTAAAIFAPALIVAHRDASRFPVIVALLVAAYPMSLISTFFGVAFVDVARRHLAGEPASWKSGLEFAWSRLSVIAAWALVATLVGVAIQALERVKGGVIAVRVAGWILSVAWAVAVFFVIPVIASSELGPIAAARESANVVKKKWVESIVGNTVINVAFGLLLIPAVMVGVIGWLSLEASPTFAVIAFAIGTAMFLAVTSVQSAVDGLFRFVLYDYAVSGTVHAPFTVEDLDSGVTAKRRWFRRSKSS